ncbi:TetR/AcrR family transcriptional regulator [Nocardia cyriacigeorgica]|uniref:Potential acrAB operon repressor n=1 Tax=Nocardia cyriacigeorgica TaxID=135487 RepID=A0A4V6ID01_9NOCA|nr:TetR/AcrR family transcriptional regulator [Nocardia cyriacigeorgica]MBF6101372.1 TetR family transcriptional regulator [Nocardia cyriacigeorgica]MBF6162272.1 TetR family transcriptional regulator [Nocardia cyriacigeorgica]MBF6201231.1 TetR family transcriptional regulator [Nocardia cyriacigeorgica]MBF6347027.1 TetR family transcriptional regulator [Nocardia cyriacigeorgica]MBF6516610.1 TetR family transcriptional regulator [Nocardia cyriacigeorgica]
MTTDETVRNKAGDDTVRFRLAVVDVALRLFAEQGYEATSVDEIAEAAGISRRTFFRQFRSKEDVIFADHEAQLAAAGEYLAASDEDPWDAVCSAVVGVFERFTQWRDIAARRYRVVRRVPALREREIVTVFRYERLFTDFLRERLPDASDLARVQFTAAVTATHNYLLRRMVRGESDAGAADLRAELAAIPRGGQRPRSEEMVVAVFPRDLPPRRVADLLEHRLGSL